jgi:hypothetical protein
LLGPLGDLLDHPGLADAGLAAQQDRRAVPIGGEVQASLDGGDYSLAPDQGWPGQPAHQGLGIHYVQSPRAPHMPTLYHTTLRGQSHHHGPPINKA